MIFEKSHPQKSREEYDNGKPSTENRSRKKGRERRYQRTGEWIRSGRGNRCPCIFVLAEARLPHRVRSRRLVPGGRNTEESGLVIQAHPREPIMPEIAMTTKQGGRRLWGRPDEPY